MAVVGSSLTSWGRAQADNSGSETYKMQVCTGTTDGSDDWEDLDGDSKTVIGKLVKLRVVKHLDDGDAETDDDTVVEGEVTWTFTAGKPFVDFKAEQTDSGYEAELPKANPASIYFAEGSGDTEVTITAKYGATGISGEFLGWRKI